MASSPAARNDETPTQNRDPHGESPWPPDLSHDELIVPLSFRFSKMHEILSVAFLNPPLNSHIYFSLYQ